MRFNMKYPTLLSCVLVCLTQVSFTENAHAADEFFSINVAMNGVTDTGKLKSDQASCLEYVEKSGAKGPSKRLYIYRQCLTNKGYRLLN